MKSGKWTFEWHYLTGQTPWDTRQTPPEVIDFVERQDLAAGRALDLGCGTGTNCIYLARHGWRAVGIDFSILAVWLARLKARRLGADCRFYRADVTDLSFLEGPFDLALDIGCLHSVPVERWKQYARGVTRLVRPGGFFLLYAFTPRPGQGDPRGVSLGEVTELFAPAFAVERREDGGDPTGPSSAWHWLRRMAGVQFRL